MNNLQKKVNSYNTNYISENTSTKFVPHHKEPSNFLLNVLEGPEHISHKPVKKHASSLEKSVAFSPLNTISSIVLSKVRKHKLGIPLHNIEAVLSTLQSPDIPVLINNTQDFIGYLINALGGKLLPVDIQNDILSSDFITGSIQNNTYQVSNSGIVQFLMEAQSDLSHNYFIDFNIFNTNYNVINQFLNDTVNHRPMRLYPSCLKDSIKTKYPDSITIPKNVHIILNTSNFALGSMNTALVPYCSFIHINTAYDYDAESEETKESIKKYYFNQDILNKSTITKSKHLFFSQKHKHIKLNNAQKHFLKDLSVYLNKQHLLNTDLLLINRPLEEFNHVLWYKNNKGDFDKILCQKFLYYVYKINQNNRIRHPHTFLESINPTNINSIYNVLKKYPSVSNFKNSIKFLKHVYQQESDLYD